MTRDRKHAGELQSGDVIVAQRPSVRTGEEMTVLSATESEVIMRRKVLLVTLRTHDGLQLQRTFGYFTSVRLVKEA